jgi:hypothetical protein
MDSSRKAVLDVQTKSELRGEDQPAARSAGYCVKQEEAADSKRRKGTTKGCRRKEYQPRRMLNES